MSFNVGFGKNEIKIAEFNIGMMGYGVPQNKALTQATPLFSRSVFFEDSHNNFVVLNVTELAFISMAIKDKVIEELQNLFPEKKFNHSNVLLSAQHTHSAPGGYSHYPFYNFTIPGFRPKTFNAITECIVESIKNSMRNVRPSKILLGSTTIPDSVPVAFNRSIKAFKNNPEYLNNIFNKKNPIDRVMWEILIKNTSDEKNSGCINLFGVHATSVPNTNTAIHHDNKGVAAKLWESHNENSIALFAQSSAGDVSPNYVYDKSRKENRGPFEDGHKNASFNGQLQYDASKNINSTHEVHGTISSHHCFKDFSSNCSTPAHGLAFFKGTMDGLGIPNFVAQILKIPCFIYSVFLMLFLQNKFLVQQGKKYIGLDHQRLFFLGVYFKFLQFLRFIPDPLIRELGTQISKGAVNTSPWVPTHLPIQIIHIGNLTILGVPGEITTMSAYRLKSALSSIFPRSTLLVWSYSNAYMGYITTPEEYDVQCYEGGHTIYGRNTLNYLIECFINLAKNNLKDDIRWYFPKHELELRSYLS